MLKWLTSERLPSNGQLALAVCAAFLLFVDQIIAQEPDTSFTYFYSSLSLQPTQALQIQRDTLTDELRAGFVTLELYRRTSKPQLAAAAAREFVAALKRQPRSAWAHFGLALTLFRAPKTMAIVRALGADAGEAIHVAKRHAAKALNIAPAFVEAADLLGIIALRVDDRNAAARARRIIDAHGPPPISASEVSFGASDTISILAHDPTRGVEYLAHAKSQFNEHHDSEGAARYFKGLALLDSASILRYAGEAALIANAQEEAALAKAGIQELHSLLDVFWRKRAVRDGISVGKRIATHYRRLAMARERYALPPNAKGAPPFGAVILKSSQSAQGLDDRGIVFVRYGEPMELVRAIGPQFVPNETWVYRNTDGTLSAYRFVANSAASGYRLIADAREMIALEHDAQLRGDSARIHAYSDDLAIIDFFSRQGKYTHQYAALAARLTSLHNYIRMADALKTEDIRQKVSEAILDIKADARAVAQNELHRGQFALQHDDAAPRFARPLPIYVDLATFRGNGCTDVIYSVSVASVGYRLFVGIADTVTWLAQGVDTIAVAPRTMRGQLRSSGLVCMPPGRNAYARVTASVSDSVGASVSEQFEIPDYSGTALAMSDIVIALPKDGPFVRGTARLAMAPPRQFKQNESFRVFYEVYNLPRGGRYRTDIRLDVRSGNQVTRLFRGKKSMKVSFEGEVNQDGVLQEIRTLHPQIEAGEVTLHVTINDLASGATASKTKTIWIMPR